MNWGPMLTTGGGLVFGGGTNDRMFRAFDARTGEVLWHFKTNSGIIAPPSLVRGRRRAVRRRPVRLGHRRRGPAGADQQHPRRACDVPQGGVIWVFALSQ